jgi:hypothetical protein
MGLKGWERNRGANSLVTGSDLRRGVKTMMQNPVAVRGSDEGRAQGETAGENPAKV